MLRLSVGLGLKAWLAWRLFGPEIAVTREIRQDRPLRIPGRTVFVGDREFFVREAGPVDATPLVLLHGWSFDGEMTFFAVIPGLAERYRLIIPDNRGHGRSEWIRGPYDVADVADDVAGVLAALGVEQAVVFGYSMGGMVAQELAHRHPSRVSKLILAATAARPIRPDAAFRVALWLGRTVSRVSRREFSAITMRVLRRTNALKSEHVRWMWEALMRRDANLYYEAGNAVRRFDARRWIDVIEVPTMVIVNTADQLVPPSAQYELASHFRDEDVVEIRGGRHESIMNRADEYVRIISEFAGRVPGTDHQVPGSERDG